MTEERQVRPGFLPPKAPGVGGVPQYQPPAPAPSPERPQFVAQRMESGARSPLALSGTVVGAIAILLLFLSIGISWFICGMFSIIGLMLGLLARKQIQQRGEGRAGQARAAIWVSSIALGLSVVAMVVWLALDASGFTPQDLEKWLRDQLEAQRAKS